MSIKTSSTIRGWCCDLCGREAETIKEPEDGAILPDDWEGIRVSYGEDIDVCATCYERLKERLVRVLQECVEEDTMFGSTSEKTEKLVAVIHGIAQSMLADLIGQHRRR